MNSISVIIPCYNEENNLKRGVLKEVYDFLSQQKYTWEVIIANDGSTDGSLQLATELTKDYPNFRILDLPHGGKPSAIWGGIQAASYPLTVFTDMDQSTPIHELDKLLPYFDQNFDVVIGSRGSHREGNTFLRKLGSKIFLLLRRSVLLRNIIDTQCGFKAFRTAVVKEIFPHLQFFKDTSQKTGWRVSSYDVELLFLAEKQGYKIKEVPVAWKNEDTSTTKGDLNDRYKKESIRMAQEVARVISNNIKGVYDFQK